MPQIPEPSTAEIVARYAAVWSEPDPGSRRAAVAGLRAPVFLLLGADGLIREDYQLTVQPLAG